MKNEDIGIHLNTDLFKESVNEKFLKNNVVEVIECGTNTGAGSTQVFVDTGVNVKTCEVNLENYKKAEERFKGVKNISLNHAFTTKKEDCDLIYLNSLEEKGFCPNKYNWLEKEFKKSYKKLKSGESLAVFLDTHWTMGFIEFKKIFNFWYQNKPLNNKIVLILDDVTNLKHRPAIRYLENSNIKWESTFKERWAIFEIE